VDWLFLELCVILMLYVADIEGLVRMAIADLQKLIENMKRAQSITDRASRDAVRHGAIMDNFERRLDLNHENMAKIEEYDKLMAEMDMLDNGGPALETTFPTSIPTTSASTANSSRFYPDGRQL
jgi:hypothetical protein